MPNVNQKMKPTPVGDIPVDWDCVRLGELLEFSQYGLSESSTESGVPYLKMSSIQDGKVIWDTADRLSVSEADLEKYCLKRGDLLFNRTNSLALVGKTGVCSDDAQVVFASYLVRLRTNDEVDPFHLIHWFNSAHGKARLKALATPGVSQSNINPPVLKKRFFIPLPPLPEQQKIAEILGTWDQAIETQQKLIDSLTLRKKALMQQLLTGKTRLPGFEEEWQEVMLSNLFSRVSTKNNEGHTQVVTISAQRGLICQQDFFKKQIASKILDNYFILKKGEFAYNKSYSKGYPMGAIKRLNLYDHGVVTILYICFKLKSEQKSHSDFWEHYFESGALNRGITRIAHEGGRAHGLLNVTLKDFFELTINAPSLAEQKAIAQVLTTADLEIKTHTDHLESLRTQKRGLMQQLLTGKTRVTI